MFQPHRLLPTWQNATDFVTEFLLHPELLTFFVNECLTGANSTAEAIDLQTQLHTKGGFLLRKWNSSYPEVINQLVPRDALLRHARTWRETQECVSCIAPYSPNDIVLKRPGRRRSSYRQ